MPAAASRRILTGTHRLMHCLPIRTCGGSSSSCWAFLQGSAPAARTALLGMAFLTVPPSLDAVEITDKGSTSQRAVLRHRAATVDALYATPAPLWVLVVDGLQGD